MKRILFVALTALAMAMIAPASQADRYSNGYHYGHNGHYSGGHYRSYRPVHYVEHRPVYVPPVPVYERPRNCYRTTVVRRGRSSAPIVAGGVIGGMIGNDIGHGRRGPTIAGTVIGALVVDKLTRGHRRSRVVSRVVCD
ncbi:MAG: hypothetical protein BMS9Abin11_0076 [Gammaproteobacteria bacterium]|nr:MAG: hypothetical protein BMS9Abin11_0076 [Gammaproteobacteria bacterium]